MRNATVTKANILKAAEEEFSQKGIYGARIEEIAKKSGSNKRMIYEYYGNKEELYTVVLENAYKRLGEKEEILLENVTDCKKAIEDILRMYYDFLKNDESFVNLIMWENLNKAEYMKNSGKLQSVKNPLIESLHKILEKGKEDGVFRNDIDEEQIAVLLITISFSYFSNVHTLSHLMNLDFTDENMMEARVNMVVEMVNNYISK
jgi:TetR/AcrR family transcriptional regulator